MGNEESRKKFHEQHTEHSTDSSDDKQLEEIRRKQHEQFKIDFQQKRDEFQKLRNSNTIEDALKAMNHLGNCLNDIIPQQASEFINSEVNQKVLFVVVNTYTKQQYKLGVGPLNDSITVSVNHKKMGYKMIYLHNTTPKHFKVWLQFVLEKTQSDLTIFYTGHVCSIKDKSGDESDGYDEVMLFDSGYVVDDELAQYLAKYAHGQRIVLLTDCCHSGSIWDIQSQPSMKDIIPQNILSVSAAKDSQTAKQTRVKQRDQGIFTYFFWDLLEKEPDLSVKQMEAKINPSINRFKQHLTYATTTPSMLDEPIFPHRERHRRRHQRLG